MYNTKDYAKNKEFLEADDLESLRTKLEDDPWNQDLYTEAIRVASTQNDFEALEHFRTEFIKHGTPDDNFWLSYIQEKRGLSTPEELIELYKLAVKNQPSVYIWLSYLRFVFDNCHNLSDYNALRDLFESSLDALGLHALDGPQLWSEFRRFEQELVARLPKDEHERQINRVRLLFYRQLRLPLAGLPDLLDEYLVWERELPNELKKSTTEGEKAHKKGFEAWEQRKCFELKIQSDFHEMMSTDTMNSLWNDYIDFELKCGDMPRIMMVYHRALDDLGLERDDLWINYANYALQTNYAKSLSICERAYRHMPRSLNIWINYFLVVASKSENVGDVLDLLEKSTTAVRDLNQKISLHITAADCVRRIDMKDVASFRLILSKCWDSLGPENTSRAVYRLLTYWSKYELKLLSFNVGSEYVDVVSKLLARFKKESFCWLYLIDAIKRLDPENPHISDIVAEIHKGFTSVIDFTAEFEPKSLHLLIIWLYELALSVVSANEVADEYIDYVQTSGVVEDIKRAHKVVAAHATPTSRPENFRPSSLSLNNILRRERRRKLETFSETSSDSGSYSSMARRSSNRWSFGVRSPWVSVKDGEFVIKSPKLGYSDSNARVRSFYRDSEQTPGMSPPESANISPVLGYKTPGWMLSSFGYKEFEHKGHMHKPRHSIKYSKESDSIDSSRDPEYKRDLYKGIGPNPFGFSPGSAHLSPMDPASRKMSLRDSDVSSNPREPLPKSSKLTLKDLEVLTRATWDGCESAEPSIAPRVPPNAPMPPPSSPVLSRLSNSGSCSPDLSPERRSYKTPRAPPPLVLISDSTTDYDYKLNFASVDSESNTERMSSDNESQIDRYENETTKSAGKPCSNTSSSPNTNTSKADHGFNVPLLKEDKHTGPDTKESHEDTKLQGVVEDDVLADTDTSLAGGHYLLGRRDCVFSWLSGASEPSTLFISGVEAAQFSELEKFFVQQQGFKELRRVRNKPCCYVEFASPEETLAALEAARARFAGGSMSIQQSRPRKKLFEDRTVFVKVLNRNRPSSTPESALTVRSTSDLPGNSDDQAGDSSPQMAIEDMKKAIQNFFKSYEFEAKTIRTTSLSKASTPRKGHGSPTTEPHPEHILGFYVEFDFRDAARTVVGRLVSTHGWPIVVEFAKLRFQVLPSIPIIKSDSNTPQDKAEHTPATPTPRTEKFRKNGKRMRTKLVDTYVKLKKRINL